MACNEQELSNAQETETTEAPLFVIWAPRFSYLHMALLTVVAVSATARFAPDGFLFKLQPSFVGVTYLGVVITGILWLRQPQLPHWPRITQVQLGLLIALWTTAIVVSLRQGSLFYFTAYVTPVVLIMILWKPLTRRQVWDSVDCFAWSLLIYLSATYLVDIINALVSTNASAFRTDLGSERTFSPIHLLLDLEGRWVGPIGHPNTSGPLAAFVVVYAASRVQDRKLMLLGGALLLAATASLTSFAAALVGIITIAFAQTWPLLRTTRIRLLVFTALACAALAAALVAFSRNWTFSGRTTIWPTYIQLGFETGFSGTGDPPVARYISTGELPEWAGHAHNLLLDVVVRNSAVAGALLVVLIALLVFASVRAQRRGSPLGLALLMVFIVTNVTEVGIDFRLWEFGTCAIVIVALLNAVPEKSKSTPSFQHS